MFALTSVLSKTEILYAVYSYTRLCVICMAARHRFILCVVRQMT